MCVIYSLPLPIKMLQMLLMSFCSWIMDVCKHVATNKLCVLYVCLCVLYSKNCWKEGEGGRTGE